MASASLGATLGLFGVAAAWFTGLAEGPVVAVIPAAAVLIAAPVVRGRLGATALSAWLAASASFGFLAAAEGGREIPFEGSLILVTCAYAFLSALPLLVSVSVLRVVFEAFPGDRSS